MTASLDSTALSSTRSTVPANRDGGGAAQGRGRLLALDGLRGIAALVVLFHHALLLNPSISSLYVDGGTAPEPGTALWWLTYSPLKLTNAGHEAVMVFFVLSGFVLALPVLRGGFDWVSYFPRRVVRLGLPVAGAVAFAAFLIAVVPRPSVERFSPWVEERTAKSVDWHGVLDALNLFNGSYKLDNPLWSIQWEMIFSVTLPVFVVLALALRRWWPIGLVAALAGVWVGAETETAALEYLPVFLIGVLLAAKLDVLQRAAERIARARWAALAWTGLFALALVLLVLRWELGAFGSIAPFAAALKLVTVVGAALLVFCCLGCRGAARPLGTRPVQFLARISFSLYLVHVPIIVALRFALPELPAHWIMVLGVLLSLLVGALFHRFVEAPAHRASGWVGRRSSALVAGLAERRA
ncbi:acyltransferase [Agromyces mediolanus]|uniref:acyltransferase family protein n=1 Tax=Agromyces mediolanus TaxID=41986 RepID=UPI003839C074